MDERDIMDAFGGDDGAPFVGMPGLGGVNFAAGGPRDQLAPVVPAQDPKELELANARREYARALQALVRHHARAVASVLRSRLPALFARPTSFGVALLAQGGLVPAAGDQSALGRVTYVDALAVLQVGTLQGCACSRARAQPPVCIRVCMCGYVCVCLCAFVLCLHVIGVNLYNSWPRSW